MAANQFFDWALQARFVRFDTVRSDDVNAALDLVTTGFNLVALAIPGTTYKGNWTTATQYNVADIVRDPGGTNNLYYTVSGHVSGVLATDIAAGRLRLYVDVSAFAGSANATEPYSERANTATMIGAADILKKIKYTGTLNSSLTFDTAANLGSGWRATIINGGTGYISMTVSGGTLRLYPGGIIEAYADLVNARVNAVFKKHGVLRDTGSGNFQAPPLDMFNFVCYRIVGSGAGGGGGGGGGSGRGTNASGSGAGGSGGSGGAPGQNGQVVTRRIPARLIAGQSLNYACGAAGTKGTGGIGGAGAVLGAAGNDGTDGNNGSAGNATTFDVIADSAFFATAAGGATGTNKGLKGLTGNNNNAAGAAVTTTAVALTGSIDFLSRILSATANGTTSIAGTAQTSTTVGTAGGASGDSAGTYGASARSGTALAPGGAAQAGAVPAAGNAPASPAAETNPGQGGLGGGGGGGSPGVGAGANAATGVGGTAANGADGGPGEIEIWTE